MLRLRARVVFDHATVGREVYRGHVQGPGSNDEAGTDHRDQHAGPLPKVAGPALMSRDRQELVTLSTRIVVPRGEPDGGCVKPSVPVLDSPAPLDWDLSGLRVDFLRRGNEEQRREATG